MGQAETSCPLCCGPPTSDSDGGVHKPFEMSKGVAIEEAPDIGQRIIEDRGSAYRADSTSTISSNRADKKFVTKTQAEMDKINAQQTRRKNVCAEVVSQEEVRNFVKPVYQKSAEDEAALREYIGKDDKLDVLCGHLHGQALQDVLNAFFRKSVKQGEIVIKQGDEGDCLYICEEGQLDIFVNRPGRDAPGTKGEKVTTVGSGSLFGELALMYKAPRAATVTVASPSAKLWALDGHAFKVLLVQTGEQQFEMYQGWLSEVDILKSFNHHELAKIADMMESTLFDADEVIITQGAPGDCFYIVEDGTCAAFISGAGGEKRVKDYKAGDYFGEIALLTDEPRKATVRATDDGCTVLSVSKENFVNILGPIADILKKNIDKYPKYAEFLK